METVAVIFGGRSAEHDVSIVTAIASIIKPLELSRKYKVEAVYIAKSGAWYMGEKLKDISLFSSGEIDDYMSKSGPVAVEFNGGMSLVRAGRLAGRRQVTKMDIVFPAMHGTYGEDGSLMGLLDLGGIPYVGCGVSASAVAMNKILAKQLATGCNLPVTKFITSTNAEISSSPKQVVERAKVTLKYPLFVKPAKLGSSIGITRVSNDSELQNALEVAAHYDDEILVEEAVNNLIELTLPIIGNQEPVPAYLEMPLTKAQDFFDFDTKYMQGGKKGKGKSGSQGAQGYSQLPADIPKELYKTAETLGLNVYKALGCSGIARIDMLVDQKTKQVYFNEVNPLPGGLYSHNWNKKGVSNIELVEKLIGYAKERHNLRSALATTFSTNYLKQF